MVKNITPNLLIINIKTLRNGYLSNYITSIPYSHYKNKTSQSIGE